MVFRLSTEADRAAVADYLQKLVLDGKKRFRIEIKRFLPNRTVDQNRLYWMWLRCIADETGDSPDSLHEYFKCEFLGCERSRVLGREVSLPRSTARLDRGAFTGYLDRLAAFCSSELGIALPLPGMPAWEQFFEKYQ